MSTGRSPASPPPPADPLAHYVAKAGLSDDDRFVLQTWIGDQLIGDQYARLEQGGHTEVNTALRKVFIDLPMAESAAGERQAEATEYFLSELLTMSPAPFATEIEVDPDEDCEPSPRLRGDLRSRAAGFLLIGGPGQGKSTLGQLACQLHRAALLRPRGAELPTTVHEVLRPFIEDVPPPTASSPKAKRHTNLPASDPSLPEAPLLPLRIVLPDAAAWLATHPPEPEGSPAALLRFLADQPSARKKLSATTLASLIAVMPVLVVLDGFDEVGATEDRAALVAAARELLSRVGSQGGSGLVVATTRPQGYAGELSQLGVPLRERHLSFLTVDQAIHYADRLAQAQIAGIDEQHQFVERFRQAAAEPATSRLMRTPLQVTILATLVHTSDAPKERWKLFYNYFDFTLRREINRRTYASDLLKTHRTKIEAVHMRVALLLQVESERAGGAAARMEPERLKEVVHAVLADEGVGDRDKDTLTQKILDAAEKRLVFLVEPETGGFGFEIRSLQEFFAAWALTSGRERAIKRRLLQVANAAMFRNVVLFMTSRFFSEGTPLRDVLAEHVCGALDQDHNDPLSRATRAGALLALEALEEGAALHQPKRARALMERAADLLDLPGAEQHVRLARVCQPDTAEALRAAVELRLARLGPRWEGPAPAAWVCLAEGTNLGFDWAIQAAERWWPSEEPARVLTAWGFAGVLPGWVVAKIEANAMDFPPESWVGWSRMIEPRALWGQYLGRALAVPRKREYANHPLRLGFRIRPLPSTRQEKVHRPAGDPPAPWLPWVFAADFILDPTQQRLAATLRCVAASLPVDRWQALAERVPWPLACCLLIADDQSHLLTIAARVEAGELGDVALWRRAQDAWGDRPPDLAATIEAAKAGDPWGVDSLESAPPLLALRVHGQQQSPKSTRPVDPETFALAALGFRIFRNPALRARFGALCIRFILLPNSPAEVDLNDFADWARAAPQDALLLRRPANMEIETWHSLLDSIAPNPEPTQARSFVASLRIRDWWEAPSHPIELRAAVCSLGRFVLPSPSQSLRDTSLAVLATVTPTTPAARADAATLRVYFGDITADQIPAILDTIRAAAAQDPMVWTRFARAAEFSNLSPPLRETLMLAAWEGLGPRHANSAEILAGLRDLMAARRSDLDLPEIWDRLDLPAPYPIRRAPRLDADALPVEPVVIQHIHLENIRGLHDLRLELSRPLAGQGQWTVLIGPNGAGKTTVLRGLVLALRDLENPAIWPDGVFETGWTRLGGPKEGRITVQTAAHGERITTLHTNGAERRTQSPRMTRPRLFPFFAYGCHRGSALGGPREVKVSDDGGPEVATLFAESAALVPAETWLLIMAGDVTSKPVLDVVLRALARLLDVQEVSCRERMVWVQQAEHPEVPLRAMSDGYLTTVGWFLDLLVRWIELARKHQQPIGEDFLQKMTGLVLIDEIDLLLHPGWQRRVIGRTREILPKMSFLVTTHNPLALVGARAEEIQVLSVRDGRIRADPGTEAPITLTGGEIYSTYFGIDDVYPDDLGKNLQRYGFLSGYALRSDAEESELNQLRTTLRAVGLALDWPEVPREMPAPDPVAKRARRTPKVPG